MFLDGFVGTACLLCLQGVIFIGGGMEMIMEKGGGAEAMRGAHAFRRKHPKES